MRVSTEHYNIIKEHIESLMNKLNKDTLINSYEKGEFYNSDKVKDLNVRFRWDMYYASGVNQLVCQWDYNDNHIDTVLKKVLPVIERKY